MNNVSELNSAVVDEPANMPKGCSDISPSAAVELSSEPPPCCAYCHRLNKLTYDGPWRQKTYKILGFWPAIPVCSGCLHKIKSGRIPPLISNGDKMAKERLRALTRHAHYVALKGGTMAELDGVLLEVDSCSVFLSAAEQEFKLAASKAAAAAEKIEWIKSLIDESKQTIERKTSVTYEFCRKIANKMNARPERRRAIFERANYKCEKCGSPDFLSVDHVIPVKRGGTNDPSNLQCLCLACNCSKGSK